MTTRVRERDRNKVAEFSGVRHRGCWAGLFSRNSQREKERDRGKERGGGKKERENNEKEKCDEKRGNKRTLSVGTRAEDVDGEERGETAKWRMVAREKRKDRRTE